MAVLGPLIIAYMQEVGLLYDHNTVLPYLLAPKKSTGQIVVIVLYIFGLKQNKKGLWVNNNTPQPIHQRMDSLLMSPCC